MRTLFLIFCLLALAAGCSSSSKKSSTASDEPWPAPPNPMELAVQAGLVPETAESLEFHVHAHLDVFRDAKLVIVPAGIGIDIGNPAVHSMDVDGETQYGGIDPPCDVPCISPLHTHAVDGVLHTESATRKFNTFGQFLTEWNVTFPPDTAVYVNGERFSGDPATIDLSNRKEIAVVIGSPPAEIPSSYDFG